VTAAEVVVGGWAGHLAVLGALLAEDRPPAVVGADPPDRAVTTVVADLACFVAQQAVAVLGIVAVSVEQGVGQVGLL